MLEETTLTTLGIAVALMFPARTVSSRLVRQARRKEPVLILGSGEPLARIERELELSDAPYHVVGVVAEGRGQGERTKSTVVEDLERAVAELRPKRVVIAMTERRGRLPLPILLRLRAEGVVIEDVLDFSERLTGKIPIEALTPSSLIFAKNFQQSAWTLGVVRAVSLALSVAALLVLAPLFLLIALAIKLDSAGPVFFIHPRLGRRGRPFDLIKFRTMHAQSGQQTSEWEGDNRSRITRVGRVLRKFRFDELPQFLNVVLGDMNLVGPRPHPVTNHELFLENIPFYPLRCFIRPGITGWAQIRYGYANNLEEETEKMRYDLFYVKHMSVLMDLRILLDTVQTVVFGRNGRIEDQPLARVGTATRVESARMESAA